MTKYDPSRQGVTPPPAATPSAEKDATVPTEAWDVEHPDHGDYVRLTRRCYGECVEHEAHSARAIPPAKGGDA